MNKKIQIDNKDDFEFVFTFKNVKIDLTFNQFEIDEKEQDRIKRIVDIASSEVVIDKSYVDYKGTKYKKTFIRDLGWNILKKHLLDYFSGASLSIADSIYVLEAYNLMICGYMYQFLDDCGIDVSNVMLCVKDKSKFLISIKEDTYREWSRYPGDWREW